MTFLPSSREGLLRLLYEEERVVVEDRIAVAAGLSLAPREALLASWRALAEMERPVFPLKGRDLLAERGVDAGPQVGELLGKVEAWWCERGFAPKREECLQEMRRLLQEKRTEKLVRGGRNR